MGIQVGSLRYLKLGSISRRDEAILKSENFAGLQNLTNIELSGSLETLGPKLLSNLISLEEFKCSRAMLTSVHELAFNQNKNLRTIKIQNSMVSTIHRDTFKGLRNLESLNLGHNKLTSIPEDLLTDLHELKELILRHNSIAELPQNLIHKTPNLATLDVSNNKIDQIFQEHLPENLSKLFLDNNLITGFDEETLKHLNSSFESNSIHLGHNPYSCECSKFKVFIEFLNLGLKAKIKDANNINFICYPHQHLRYMSDIMSEMCPVTVSVYASYFIFANLLVFLLALVLKKKEYLQDRFYSLPWVLNCFPEDWNLKYDVFISYSDHDKDFVEGTLWPQLEKNKSYSCCVHVRDFVVGDAILDQIFRAVGQSRRTIIVLSPEYAAATWTKLEFQAAHSK